MRAIYGLVRILNAPRPDQSAWSRSGKEHGPSRDRSVPCVAAWLKDVRIQKTNPPPMRWSPFQAASIANFGFTPIAFTTKGFCEQRFTSKRAGPKLPNLPLTLSLALVFRRQATESSSPALDHFGKLIEHTTANTTTVSGICSRS